MPDPKPQLETIALAIRDHQRALRDWPYAGLAQRLHRWVEIFHVEFKLQLPAYPVVRFAPLRNAYATYAFGRSDVGTRDNITFNSRELSRSLPLVLRTLCHECCISGNTTTADRAKGDITTPNSERWRSLAACLSAPAAVLRDIPRDLLLFLKSMDFERIRGRAAFPQTSRSTERASASSK